MTGTTTTVSATTLIIGPCTYFGVDSTDLGGTLNGVQAEKKQKLNDTTVDQVPGAVGMAIEDEDYRVKTQIAAATLENLQLAWGLSAAPVTVVGPPATKTLNIGIERKVIEHSITFTGPAPDGKVRTFTFPRVVAMVAGAAEYDKKKQYVYPIEFKCLPTLATSGAEYGTVVEE